MPPLPPLAASDAPPGEAPAPSAAALPSRLLVAAAGSCVVLLFLALSWRPGALGVAAPPQGDVFIFYQYARAWVEGHPYAFVAGASPTTGSTSHLYPLLLVPAVAAEGWGGDPVVAGGALLGVLFVLYLGVVRNLVGEWCPAAPRLGWALVALSGQTAYTFLSQMEMGPFVVLTGGAWLASLRGDSRRARAAQLLLVGLAPWVRPDGALLGAALACGEVAGGGGSRRHRSGRAILLAASGGVSLAGVLAWNAWWTGRAGFDSTAGKGLFAGGVTAAALREAIDGWWHLLSGFWLGLGEGMRPFLGIPVATTLLAAIGWVDAWRDPRDDSPARRLAASWGAAALAVTGLAAMSGWAGLHHDRYLAWLVPGWLLFAAQGVGLVRRRQGACRVAFALGALLLLWQAWGLGMFAVAFDVEARATARHVRFLRDIDARLESGARVGDVGASGLIAWHLRGAHVINLHGVTSPEFATPASRQDRARRLREDPALRCDYFLIYEGLEERDPWVKPLLGRVLAVDPRAREGERRFRLFAARAPGGAPPGWR